MRQGYNNNNLKYRNRGIVLQLIATEPIYRADITKKIGLTRMAISNIVGELIQEGYIVEKEFEEKGSIGRNPILLDISPTSPLCVGLYISREFLYVVLSDIKLNSLYLDKVKLINENEESLVSKIYMVLDGLFNFYNEKFNNRAILGIGVSCIGPFDPVECVLLNPRDFFGISNLSIKEVIQKKYPYSVFGANDMNGAALAESLMGCGQEFNNFLYLGITHGIGSGVIVNKRLYGRESISSGELGHMTIDYNGNLCTCGKKGCLETYATIPNIINRLQEKCGCENICPEDFESLCLDPCCDEVFCDVTEKLSIALVNAVNKPSGVYKVERVIESLKKFEGRFILQTMFVRSSYFDTTVPEALSRWMDIVRELSPKEVMIYTIDRETPDKSLEKYTVEEMTAMVQPLLEEGFDIQVRG